MSPRRRATWLKSSSDGFRPIKGVGVAVSIGFPLLVVGVLTLAIAIGTGSTLAWWIGGGAALIGLLAAITGIVT